MSSLNARTVTPAPRTFNGAVASRIGPVEQLTRTVMTCMLWEDSFYENGVFVADRIKTLVHSISLAQASAIAIEARNNMKLRHVPLLIVREMARHPKRDLMTNRSNGSNHTSIISQTLAEVIQRPDELTEFLAIYWKDGKQPLSKQVKLGLAKAFSKFNEYSLAKYNRDKDVKLKDVLFLCHSKPADVPADALPWNKTERGTLALDMSRVQSVRPDGFTQGELLYGKLIYDQLATPDTWEVKLSRDGNNAAAWHRLMLENKLGDLAFLRNLNNMTKVNVPKKEIIEYGDARRWGRVLPFRFLSAARMVPQMEPELERWMLKCMEGADKMKGRTALLIDVSGSMSSKVSGKSDLSRLDAAKALAILLREVCDDVDIFTFNTATQLIPARRGFALGDAIGRSGGGTDHEQAVEFVRKKGRYNRTIILTDEQSSTPLPRAQNEKSYIINVAAYQNGIGYESWLHINGWSESVIDYIQAYERNQVWA